MLFNSLRFLIFFPIVTLLYFIIPKRVRYLWLLAASYYFYMCWNPKYALLLLFSTAVTYASGLLLAGAKTVRAKKGWVAASFAVNLAILFFFKYFDFAVGNLNALLGVLGAQPVTPHFDVVLPVGISFYIFQALSYTVDVYRGDIAPVRNFFRYALFVSFFPQLVAGPIERSDNLLPQLENPQPFSYARMRSGLVRMGWGLFQKMVVADRMAILADRVFGNVAEYAGFEIVLAVLFFSVQIYCDFAGYSNVAIGAAEVLGIRLMDNFERPYFAKSIKDVWRRWHISLSTWFRDYLYIPLGGNRKGCVRKYLNLMITFLLSGLWHGASWHYVVWGGLHGAYQVVGDVTEPVRRRLRTRLHVEDKRWYGVFRMLITFLLVCLGWIFFRAKTVSDAFLALRQMFSVFNPGIVKNGLLYTLGLDKYDFWAAIAAAAVLFIVDALLQTRDLRASLEKKPFWLRWPVYLLLIVVLLVFGVYGPQYDASAFIYFQF